MHIHPYCVNNSLTRRAFYEAACFGDDGHFDRVPDVVLEVVIAKLSGKLKDIGICAIPDGPGSGECGNEIEEAVAVVAEDADGEKFAEGCARSGEWASCEVALVADEVDPI